MLRAEGVENALVETVRFILTDPLKYEWSLQGFGLLRLYLENDTRLHVWSRKYRYPNVSMIHDHLQWGLESTIVVGHVTNIKYVEDPEGDEYKYMVIKPGVGTRAKSRPKKISLKARTRSYYKGDTYAQYPEEIHETDASDGTVTIMKKYPTEDDSARVFWPKNGKWDTAEPRPANEHEILDITRSSLKLWFK